MAIKVVTFHVPTRKWAHHPHPYGGIRLPHTDLIPLFVESVRHTSPEAELVLLTSRDSINVASLFDKVMAYPIEENHLMLERLRCQRDYRARSTGPIAFLDSDVLVIRPLQAVFRMAFDLAVTVRDQPRHTREIDMPYNNGVWFLKGDRIDQEVAYLDHLIHTNEVMSKDKYAWAGNQWAVVKTLGRHTAWESFTAFDLEVLVLPCTQYNHAPETADEKWDGRSFLHFHGSYKNLMRHYACSMGIAASPPNDGTFYS